MTKNPNDVQAYLEKIAATAGDPPEHGLDGVMARRRRRTRHRRGAVATAMALAVGGFVTVSWLSGVQHNHDVAAGSTGKGSPERHAQLPDTVELTCASERIDVPLASIRPQADGLHLRVDNQRGVRTDVWVLSDGPWRSGRFSVAEGVSSQVLAAPPGKLTVGCNVGSTEQQRQIELVDVDHRYTRPELDCATTQQKKLPGAFPMDRTARSLPAAARAALGNRIRDTDQIRPFSGYPEVRYDTRTVDPAVEVRRRGQTVAVAHFVGTPDPDAAPKGTVAPALLAPWTKVRVVDYCPAFVAPPGTQGPEGQRSPS